MRYSAKIRSITARGFRAVYRAALRLPRQTLTFVSGIIRRHQKAIGSPRRRLNPDQQALLVLAYQRKGRDVR